MTGIAGLRKERVKSVIVCKDREFKQKAVQLLKGAAFPSEKFTVDKIEDAVDHINTDQTVLNLVIDGSMYSPDALEKALRYLEDQNNNENVNMLCILDDAQSNEEDRFDEIFKRSFLELAPMRQAQFNRAFHSKKYIKKANILHPEMEQGNEQEESVSNPKAPSLSIIETSQHLKDTVDMINTFTNDRSQIASVVEVGQRFNGLIGAFHFFGSKEGYPNLRELAEMIDAIGRTYEKGEHEEIAESHLSFLKRAAKCSYLILMDLRNDDTISPEHLTDHDRLTEEFHQLEGLRVRDNVDQSSVDEIIAAQIPKSS